MMNQKDVEKLIRFFATRYKITTKGDFLDFRREIEEGFAYLEVKVNSYSQKAGSYLQDLRKKSWG